MPRTLFLTAILSLSAMPMQARMAPATREQKTAASQEPKPRPARRVLFRTDVPRPPAPVVPKPNAPGKAPVRREPVKPAMPLALSPAKPRRVAPSEPPKAVPPIPASRRELELQPTTFTPYDRYLGTVRAVFAELGPRDATMTDACELVRAGRRFRYHVTDPYRAQSPAVTKTRSAGDCKSKALWLYNQLGDPAAYYVIGKLERRSRSSHAWVYWRHDDRWWILDPTDRAAPVAADSVSPSRYVPYYSYSKAGSFRHGATRLMLAMNAASTMAVQAQPAVGGSRTSRR